MLISCLTQVFFSCDLFFHQCHLVYRLIRGLNPHLLEILVHQTCTMIKILYTILVQVKYSCTINLWQIENL